MLTDTPKDLSKPLLYRQLDCVTEGLPREYYGYFTKISADNALAIANYILSVKSETTLSDHYRMTLIKVLSKLSVFTGNRPFRSMTRDTDVLPFLDTIRKPEGTDPMHKWIGTYNLYNAIITRFFKWLYSPDIAPAARPKPSVVENIGRLKRREISIYKPTDLWSEEDDKLFLKYCPSKRIKCYHMVSRDTSCRPNEILKLKVKDIVFKTSGNYQYAEVLVNGKTGTRNIPLINSIPYVKDYLDHEHPQPGNPNAPFICGIGKSLGRHVGVDAIYRIYDNYKKEYFIKLLKNLNVPSEDKQKLRELLKKPWNPYIRRHTGLTEKSLKIPGLINQYAGWSLGSTMPQKYLHYFGNESSNSLLAAYGIVTKDNQQLDLLKPKQCPNCNEPNKLDSKFCAKCRMVLTYDAYNETLVNQQEKEDKLNVMEERFNLMQSQMQSVITALGSMDESTKNTFAKQLFSSGIYVRDTNS